MRVTAIVVSPTSFQKKLPRVRAFLPRSSNLPEAYRAETFLSCKYTVTREFLVSLRDDRQRRNTTRHAGTLGVFYVACHHVQFERTATVVSSHAAFPNFRQIRDFFDLKFPSFGNSLATNCKLREWNYSEFISMKTTFFVRRYIRIVSDSSFTI